MDVDVVLVVILVVGVVVRFVVLRGVVFKVVEVGSTASD